MSAAGGALSVKYRPVILIFVLAAIAGCLVAFLDCLSREDRRERAETAPPPRERAETPALENLPPMPLRNERREAGSAAKHGTATTDAAEPDGTKGASLETAASADRPPLPLRNAKRQPAAAKKKAAKSETAKSEPAAPAGAKAAKPQTGQASWYDFHGQTTANGETMDREALTAAHKSLPLGSKAVVENLDNGREVEVRINDRGPFVGGRIIDLSKEAAEQLDLIGEGVAEVIVKPAGAAPASDKHAKR